MVVGLAGRGGGGKSAAVEGVERGDDLIGAVAVEPAKLPGQLNRAFIGFSPAIAEKDFVKATLREAGIE